MSKVNSFLIIITLAFMINSCSTSSKKNNPINMVANFEIEGMVCEHGCKGVIEKEMGKTNGITSFDIDFENATAEVFFDANVITSKSIIDQVESINDGIYKIKLTKEYKQMNAKESLPSSSNDAVSVNTFSFKILNINRFVLEWIRM